MKYISKKNKEVLGKLRKQVNDLYSAKIKKFWTAFTDKLTTKKTDRQTDRQAPS